MSRSDLTSTLDAAIASLTLREINTLQDVQAQGSLAKLDVSDGIDPVVGVLKLTAKTIGEAWKAIYPEAYLSLDYEDPTCAGWVPAFVLPIGLVMSRDGDAATVPISFTGRTIVIGATSTTDPVVIVRKAPDAGARLVKAIKAATNGFFNTSSRGSNPAKPEVPA